MNYALCYFVHYLFYVLIIFGRPVIGFFGKQMGSIGVERPQDLKFKGEGTITITKKTVVGTGTSFNKQLTSKATILATTR